MMRLNFTMISLVSLLAVSCQATRPPRLCDFESDGCSCFPNGTPRSPDLWKQDCEVHDYAYWKGGTWGERKEADLKFRESIRERGQPVVAEIAYAGVRVGGTPWLPTPWRWGFGWSGFPRGYAELSEEEERLVGSSGLQ